MNESLLKTVNERLSRDGIGNADFIEIKNDLVFASWGKEKIQVGYLSSFREEKNIFVYRLNIERQT